MGVYMLCSTENSMASAPWLHSSLDLNRHIGYFLISIGNFHTERLAEFLYPIADHGPEICLNIMPNDEYELIKSGSYRIVDAVVDDKMSVVINWCKLFYASAKPGADARCKDYEGLHYMIRLLFL